MAKTKKAANTQRSLDQQLVDDHPQFVDLMQNMLRTYAEKNRHYAAGGPTHGAFQRVANIMTNYPRLDTGDPTGAAVGMLMKHLDNVLWALHRRSFYRAGEVVEHLRDLAIYVMILQSMWYDQHPDAK